MSSAILFMLDVCAICIAVLLIPATIYALIALITAITDVFKGK